MSTELDKARALYARKAAALALIRDVWPGAHASTSETLDALAVALTDVDRLTAALAEAEAERDALRAQVAELQRLGASILKAADAAREAERDRIVSIAWKMSHPECPTCGCHIDADDFLSAIGEGAATLKETP